MNRIYSNIKQIALSLLVVGLAISTQAFRNAEKEKLATDWYAPLNPNLSAGDSAKNSFTNYNSTPLEDAPTCNQEEYVCAARFPDINAAPTQIVYINQ